MSDPTFTVIAPIYNEIENLPLLYERVKNVMDQTDEGWELILVDDGSADGSTDVIRELAAKDSVGPSSFARNFGSRSPSAGMDWPRASGLSSTLTCGIARSYPRPDRKMARRLPDRLRRSFEREGGLVQTDHSLALQTHLQDHRRQDHNTGDFRLIDRTALDIINDMRERIFLRHGRLGWFQTDRR